MPKRIQRSRRKGWRKPDGAVIVDRTSRWGNPFTKEAAQEAGYEGGNAMLVEAYQEWLRGNPIYSCNPRNRDWVISNVHELAGKDLICFCQLDQPCHADILLRMANED